MGSNKFSLDNFKKWMKDHHSEIQSMTRPESSGPIGKHVESKISATRLVDKMNSEANNLEEMAFEFRESGGRVVDMEGHDFIIEVSSGCFKIHRMYIKKA